MPGLGFATVVPVTGESDEGIDANVAPRPGKAALARRIGPFDATMIVMGGMIGSGIFLNPAVVARSVHSSVLILGAWLVGGAAALLATVVCGFAFAGPSPAVDGPPSSIPEFGAALIPVLFCYGGWQTASFIAGEMRDPGRDLPRALIAGVCGVIALYSLVVFICLRTLGPLGLSATAAPAFDVMTRALGRRGGAAISAGIALSTLGFLSQSILTAPRVYFAMAEDGLFFHTVARVSRRTRVPAVAIGLQGAVTIALALLGTYEAILRYVVAIDFVFFALTAGGLFVFRRRSGLCPRRSEAEGRSIGERRAHAMRVHP